ncbi:ABC transporter ATP-binding protein [Agrobacterium tumefaciens]|uniref:ABC transporter ATP-binding protein n=1 Tax=Agrobacterium tumefaciens TaxID=358 RepID=UPI0012B9E64B|nr:ABC transporter ATP-binding protein [Agrobacterium tumefaciens]MQB08025.1 ABC transporter ATP-binding protein [Agrobacterium tumefaciens]
MLNVTNLEIEFEFGDLRVTAVDDLSFRLEKSQVLAIVGESGSGKSLASSALMGLQPPPSRIAGGSIRFHGDELVGLPERAIRKLRGRKIAKIFQDPSAALDPVFTCGAQLIEALRLYEPSIRVGEARERAKALLARVKIVDPDRVMNAYPHELSGGMCQRVMIAMALLGSPEILIADEPTTALDVTVQAEVMALLKELHQNTQMAILLITHDLGLVYEAADRVLVMYAGTVMEEAPAAVLFSAPLNPYTQALIDSNPSTGARGGRLATIDGNAPSLGQFPAGCRFAPRCRFADEQCRVQQPPIKMFGESLVRCWKAGTVG